MGTQWEFAVIACNSNDLPFFVGTTTSREEADKLKAHAIRFGQGRVALIDRDYNVIREEE